MKFSKRHYEAVAKTLAAELASYRNQSPRIVVIRTAHSFADLFASDNPRFNRRRFLEAVGAL